MEMPRRDAATVRLAVARQGSGAVGTSLFGGPPPPATGTGAGRAPACRDTAAPAPSLPGGRAVAVSLPCRAQHHPLATHTHDTPPPVHPLATPLSVAFTQQLLRLVCFFLFFLTVVVKLILAMRLLISLGFSLYYCLFNRRAGAPARDLC